MSHCLGVFFVADCEVQGKIIECEVDLRKTPLVPLSQVYFSALEEYAVVRMLYVFGWTNSPQKSGRKDTLLARCQSALFEFAFGDQLQCGA